MATRSGIVKPKKRSDGRWEAKVTVGYKEDGKLDRKSIYGRTKREVEEKMLKLLSDKQRGLLADPQGHTLGSYLSEWLDLKQPHIAATTYNAYRCALKKLKPLQKVRLEKVTVPQILKIYKIIIDSGLSMRTAQITHTTLHSAIKDAVQHGYLARDFMHGMKPPRPEKPEIYIWTEDEIKRFMNSVEARRLYALFYVALCTGMRRGELIGLRWKDVQLHADGSARITISQNVVAHSGRITVKQPKTAGSKRSIDIAEDVVAVLIKHRTQTQAEVEILGEVWQEHGLVFPSAIGTYLQPRNLSRTFDILVKRAAVTRVGLHSLRHAHASHLIKQGTDALTVSERLGHSDVAFTQRVYQRLFDEQRKRAAIGLKHILGA